MKKKLMIVLSSCFLLMISGCGGKMKDGYYTAEMSDYSNGWKEYVCILVKNDTIVSAEFNAKDASGFIKAWDNEYMRNMGTAQGTYPNQYTRMYVQQLIEEQKNLEVDTVTGASHSGNNFRKLVPAVIEQAKKGDAATVIVESEEE